MEAGTRARHSGATPENGAADVSIEGGVIGDRIYQITITFFAACIPLLLLVIGWEIASAAWPALREYGASFLTSSVWDPVNETYGVAPAIYGTIVTSVIALLIATPLALGVAIFLSEFAPMWLRQPVAFLVDLLAAIPSVVYGLWGIVVLLPLLREHVAPFLTDTLGLANLPLFAGPFYPGNMLAAGLILAIMVLPYISAVAREILMAVPRSQREAALALGATKWETTWKVVVPAAAPGILTGVILAMARAAGEVAPLMIVGMVKLAPTLPIDLHAPFVHLERKFMHLGFHIYDVGFQSPNVDATKPLVFATALLLILVVTAMNLVAISIRNRLRRRYAGTAV